MTTKTTKKTPPAKPLTRAQKRAAKAAEQEAAQAVALAKALADVGGKKSRLMQKHAETMRRLLNVTLEQAYQQEHLEDAAEMFAHHEPTPDQLAAMAAVRAASLALAEVFIRQVPILAYRYDAVRKLHECMMLANSGIVLAGRLS